MTETWTLILTAAIPWIFVLIVVNDFAGKRRARMKSLQQRLQNLERRELAAANAEQDMRTQLLQLQNSLAHNQRLLMNSLTRSGRLPSSTITLAASRDERKLRDLLPLG